MISCNRGLIKVTLCFNLYFIYDLINSSNVSTKPFQLYFCL